MTERLSDEDVERLAGGISDDVGSLRAGQWRETHIPDNTERHVDEIRHLKADHATVQMTIAALADLAAKVAEERSSTVIVDNWHRFSNALGVLRGPRA